MATRATWKGTIKLAELAFPVALYAAATTSKRISFHILNRKTGNRVHREYVDEQTEEPVESEEQVKGYEIGHGRIHHPRARGDRRGRPGERQDAQDRGLHPLPRGRDRLLRQALLRRARRRDVLGRLRRIARGDAQEEGRGAGARGALPARAHGACSACRGSGSSRTPSTSTTRCARRRRSSTICPTMKIEGEMLDLATPHHRDQVGQVRPARVRRPLRPGRRRTRQGQDRGPRDQGAEAPRRPRSRASWTPFARARRSPARRSRPRLARRRPQRRPVAQEDGACASAKAG